MKKLFTILAAAAVAVSLITGLTACKTVVTTPPGGGAPVTTTTLDTNLTIALIGAVVPPAVSMACTKDRNAGPYFSQAATVLKALATGGDYDPVTISNALSRISIRELRSATAAQAEVAALAIYQAYFAQVVDAKLIQVIWLQPVLNSLADAIQSGVPQ